MNGRPGNVPEPSAATSADRIIALSAPGLYMLANPYEVDGRVSAYPVWARGYASSNSYLLLEDDEALLVDTGLSVHEDALLEQVGRLLGDRRLSVYAVRYGEFSGVCNMRPLAENFDVDTLYCAWPNAVTWMDVRPGYTPPGTPIGHGRLGRVKCVTTTSNGTITIGSSGRRVIRSFSAPLRLLSVHWLYDAASEALLTADAFAHVWRDSAAGPWTVTSADDDIEVEALLDYLVATRFWWLNGANTEPLARALRDVIARCADLRIIGPSNGCALVERSVVRRHVELLVEALGLAATREPDGVGLGSHYHLDRRPTRNGSPG